ncbi:hypothetical protein Hanom_Chr04g00339581 [Helianthus anomalus]
MWSHWKQSLYFYGVDCRGKIVYILPSSYPTLALLLVGFTEYDDDNDTYMHRENENPIHL